MPLVDAEAWADFLERRSDGLRKKGILSIGIDGYSAVLAPAAPGSDNAADDNAAASSGDDEPSNPWENPASYPTGYVPKLGVDNDVLPEIPTFGGDR